MRFSLNNRLILEVYEQTGLKQEIKNGLAIPGQRDGFKGLKLLTPAKFSDGTIIPEGSVAWFREETLYGQPWTKKIYKLDDNQRFIVADFNFVDMIEIRDT